MYIQSNTFQLNYSNSHNCSNNPNNTKSSAISFQNQTTRGGTKKVIAFLENLPDTLTKSLQNKLKKDEAKYKNIGKTRWQKGNKRYKGKDQIEE